jgi:dolichyl-phosphate beta-glucosyltransferase
LIDAVGDERTIIVVPCFNEAARLDVSAFAAFVAARSDVSFLFVDDGSIDSTGVVVRALQDTHHNLRGMSLAKNVGKAGAVRAGVLEAVREQPTFIGYWDADLATPLSVIPLMLELLHERSDVELVLGSRVLLLGRTIRRRSVRHYLGRVFSSAVSMITRIEVYDSQCGAKILRNGDAALAAFEEPFITRWLFDVEILLRLRNLRGSLDGAYEYVLPRWVDVAGSKVKRSDFFRAIGELLRLRRMYMKRAES